MGWVVGQYGLSRVPSSSEILRLAKEKPYAINKIPQFQELNHSKRDNILPNNLLNVCLLISYI